MAMRLLKPQEGNQLRKLQEATELSRSLQLDKVLKDKRKEIQDLDNQLVNRLSEVGKQGADEVQLWKDRINALTIEVDALESRRKSALVPLEEREKEVQDKHSALLKREELVAIKETDVEETKELLQERLDAVSEREQDATKYSLILNNREFAIQLQEKQIGERMSALTEILQESLDETQKAQAEAARYKAVLKGRDVSITEREKYVEKQNASFANRELRIADRYKTLLRAITETKLKK